MTDPVQEGFTPARVGDYVVVCGTDDRWRLGEVTSVLENGRVDRAQVAGGHPLYVGMSLLRVLRLDRVNKQRAFGLWLEAPESFGAWEEAADYLRPALLREGEAPEDL